MKNLKNLKLVALFLVVGLLFSGCCYYYCNNYNFRRLSIVEVIYPDGLHTYPRVGADSHLQFNSRCYDCSQIILHGRLRGGGVGLFTLETANTLNLPEGGSVPSSLTFDGSGLDTTYGMPMVDIEDLSGNYITTADATSVASDGTSMTTNVPSLSTLWSGQYGAVIYNRTSDGNWLEVGDATITITGHDPVDADGDGWYSDVDCDDNDPNVNPGADPNCTGMYFDENCNGVFDWQECEVQDCNSGIQICQVY